MLKIEIVLKLYNINNYTVFFIKVFQKTTPNL